MIGASVHEKLFDHCIAQFGFWKHATNANLNDGFGFATNQMASSFQPTATGVTSVALEFFLVHFITSEADLFSIDNHDIVAAINMRGEGRLVLAPQYRCNAGKQAACCLVGCIYNVPVPLNLFFLRRHGVITPSIHDFLRLNCDKIFVKRLPFYKAGAKVDLFR